MIRHSFESAAKLRILGVSLLAASLAWVPGSAVRAGTVSNPPTATFALYDPGQPYANDGVWDEEVRVLETLFKAYGFTYRKITDADINAGQLLNAGQPRYKALITPGGWAWRRNVNVKAAGEASIRDFLNKGGNYIGFCAGAYNAADKVVFAEHATGGGRAYNQTSDYVSYDYDLGILPGAAKGPFGWARWADGANPSLQEVRLDQNVPALKAAGLPAATRLFYSGGPYFPGIDGLPGLEVWARAQKPEGTSAAASTGDGEATIIRYGVGKGWVTLFSYHADVLVQERADNMRFTVWDSAQGKFLNESDFVWDPGAGRSVAGVNIDGWNIVHAALQLAAGQAVTPVKALPQTPSATGQTVPSFTPSQRPLRTLLKSTAPLSLLRKPE